MKTFKDLQNNSIRFKNGYGIDIIGGLNLYNGTPTYEIEILKDGKPCSDAPIVANTMGYKTEEQVDEIMVELQLL